VNARKVGVVGLSNMGRGIARNLIHNMVLYTIFMANCDRIYGRFDETLGALEEGPSQR
jgi:3-hydroxyisobutyrate dehydrogenase-like beta-hydroxyacid dehydrogenase